MIHFEQAVCTDLERARKLEWLETNGLGGFASSTIAGLNTRRYHGLLTAATKPPVGRVVLLSKLEETLVIGDRRYELSANQYLGAIYPQGHRYLGAFRLDPYPIFTYFVEGIEIEKHVFMVQGENTTVLEYHVRSTIPCSLELRPLIAFRDYHGTTHRNDALNTSVAIAAGVASVRQGPLSDVSIRSYFRVGTPYGLCFLRWAIPLYEPFELRARSNAASPATGCSISPFLFQEQGLCVARLDGGCNESIRCNCRRKIL